MLFSSTVAGLMAGRGIMVPMGISTNAESNVTVSLTVYSGTQPTAANVADNWSTYNTSYLFHMPNVEYKLQNPNSNTQCGLITNANYPTSNTSINSNTASWCIIWCSNIQEGSGAGQLSNTAIPDVNYVVGPVTLYTGKGIVRLSDLSITTGNTYNFVDSSIYFNKI